MASVSQPLALQVTEAQIEAICERAAKNAVDAAFRKLGCPDPDEYPAEAAQWFVDAQTGVGVIASARKGVGNAFSTLWSWFLRSLVLAAALGFAVMAIRFGGGIEVADAAATLKTKMAVPK